MITAIIKKYYKKANMHRRLLLFFAVIAVCVILLFTFLLMVFGITGSGRQTIYRYMESELTHISESLTKDFEKVSVNGIRLSEALSQNTENYLADHNLSVHKLLGDPEALENMLDEQIPILLSAAKNNACGGVFVIFDGETDGKLPGFFVKRTQPITISSVSAKAYCLRGSASVARNHDIELLGQWQMKYGKEELPFFEAVMETARNNESLSLSRLYYWTGRICLEGNSEKGLLLCVPLRSSDGEIYGICGIEVSDRMFKQLYSPAEGSYQGMFTIFAPVKNLVIQSEHGLLAGNSYLTGIQMNSNLTPLIVEQDFTFYQSVQGSYGGINQNVKMYSQDSPYSHEKWVVSVMMPEVFLEDAIKGSSTYLSLIVIILLIISLAGCAFMSKYYFGPMQKGIDLLVSEKENTKKLYEAAQVKIDRLTDSRKQDIDPDDYSVFLGNLEKLTSTEHKIFELYREGHSTKEILEILQIKENTLKYHNKNIYGKLGVSSRKQLLMYAELMEQ